MKLYPQKGAQYTREDLSELARRLVVLGYTVRITKYRPTAKGTPVPCVEIIETKSAAPGADTTEDG